MLYYPLGLSHIHHLEAYFLNTCMHIGDEGEDIKVNYSNEIDSKNRYCSKGCKCCPTFPITDGISLAYEKFCMFL